MKKIYIAPITNVYLVNSNAIMLEASDRQGETGGGEWGGGYSKGNGGSSMWEHMSDDED